MRAASWTQCLSTWFQYDYMYIYICIYIYIYTYVYIEHALSIHLYENQQFVNAALIEHEPIYMNEIQARVVSFLINR